MENLTLYLTHFIALSIGAIAGAYIIMLIICGNKQVSSPDISLVTTQFICPRCDYSVFMLYKENKGTKPLIICKCGALMKQNGE